MKVYECDSCGAEVKGKKPDKCPLCGSDQFTDRERPDPTKDDEKFTKLYSDVVDKLNEYDEDCDPYDRQYYSQGE